MSESKIYRCTIPGNGNIAPRTGLLGGPRRPKFEAKEFYREAREVGGSGGMDSFPRPEERVGDFGEYARAYDLRVYLGFIG